jgi:DNA-binding NarL/FixJ family response regulator
VSHKTTIAFVDDHPVLLNGMVNVFRDEDEFEVVAQGACAKDALDITLKYKPDVLIVDLNMPGDVFSAMTDIISALPATKIVAFTATTEIDTAVKTLRAGASGYVLKGSTEEELRDGIVAVMQGETFVTQHFAGKVLAALSAPIDRTISARLSSREAQIVELLLQGLTNREMADNLKISEKTVKHYMSVLMQKLNARNRLEVAMAVQRMHSFMAPTFMAERRPVAR